MLFVYTSYTNGEWSFAGLTKAGLQFIVAEFTTKKIVVLFIYFYSVYGSIFLDI